VGDPADPDLSLDEVTTTAILIAVAGHETTANLLGAALIRCSHPPPDASRLAETLDPDHPGSFTELLRVDSPVQTTARTATTDHRIDGVDIGRGQSVVSASLPPTETHRPTRSQTSTGPAAPDHRR
jgi:cytochrome P450